MIYLDYQATTPLAPEVRTAMEPWFDKFANPHSASRWGREAAAAIEVARDQVSACMPSGGQTVFTSGATEALNWALQSAMARTDRRGMVAIVTEHAAVRDTLECLESRGAELFYVPVGGDGLVDLDAVRSAINRNTAVVAAMLVNNEIGVVQPVTEIAAIAHEAGALMVCDAVQGFGRMPIPGGPDLVAACAHKVHGPKMIGALWIRSGLRIEPFIHGGGQQSNFRSGTLSPMLCVGFGTAAELATKRREEDAEHVERLWDAALRALGPDWIVNGSIDHRYHGNLNVRRDALDSARLLANLRDLAFSLGSACASGSGRPSHVLRALGLSDRQARSSIRLGFGRYTTEAELVDACTRIRMAADAQRIAA